MRSLLATALVLASLGMAACGTGEPESAAAAGGAAQTVQPPAIDGQAVLEHTKILASDEFEGRKPGTKGEDLTVAYIAEEFKKAGVEPGNPDGSYFQKVPLVGIKADPNTSLVFRKNGRQQRLRFRDDVVAWTKRVTDTVSIDRSEVVFVGYGVQAPEFDWDDFKGADVKGKTMVVLINDPPVPDPANPSALDPNVFGGKAMTYYGRWSYKYEMGEKLGAAGVIIVHETEPAAYPFAVVQGRVAEQFDLVAPDKNMSRPAIEGWITLDRAKELFALAGQDFEAMKRAAVTREFKPVPLGVTASMTIRNTIRTIDSRNVVGKVTGSDAALKDEYVIYTSHWDHFGVGEPVNGETIYRGARDNATGIGGLIEIGRGFAQLPARPKRSILLLAVTAEEQGLLGSDYYAKNPLYPLSKTLAVINMDSLNVHGRTRDISITGHGNSDLDTYAEQVAATQGRVIKPDPAPERGGYYRSDHFPFAKQGVPALASSGGVEYIGKPEGWGLKMQQEYTANDYHKPSDTVRPDWDMSGAAEDLQYYWLVGYRVAQADTYPEWKPGTEFRALREKMLRK
ncbi:MAG TPA: M28 family metallopeptidase [Vicinamibacterales bacterium]|nr:M28 family metallopeptidase [Vicinamibacterales bacterium]